MLALSTYLGHSTASGTYWYLNEIPSLMRDIAERCETHDWSPVMTLVAPHITAFLQQFLPVERCASVNTCDTYADGFKLLFTYASRRLKVPPYI
jgi:hypothetical protein